MTLKALELAGGPLVTTFAYFNLHTITGVIDEEGYAGVTCAN